MVPDEPQLVVAIGAALVAAERALKMHTEHSTEDEA